MSRIIVFLILLSFLVSACSVTIPVFNPTPTNTATPTATNTLTPNPTQTSTNTPEPPTETPQPISVSPPSGIPESEWKGIPIMSGAVSGESEEDAYLFTTRATVEEVQTYYETELANRGWSLVTTIPRDSDAVMLIFDNGVPPLMPVTIVKEGNLTVVLIVTSQE